MFAVCLFVFSAYFERKCTKICDFQKISSKIVPGLFIMDFSHFLYVIFHFLGPAVPTPHKGDSNKHFLEECAIGIRIWLFLELTAGTQHYGSRKYRYARFWLEKNSTRSLHTSIFLMFGKAQFVRTIIFVMFVFGILTNFK